jgi:hypothetical protein
MKKITTLVLMLCLTLSGALCPAYGTVRTETEKGRGTPITVIIKSQHGGTNKGGSIVPTIDGHYLTVVFFENLGQVTIEVSTVSGTSVHFTTTPTPNGVQCFIPNAGDYIVNFTLPNGDEYYGEFTVTD